MRTIFAAAATLLLTANLYAQDASMLLDLRERTEFNLCTQTSLVYDHDEYAPWTFNNYQNCPQLYNYQITEPYYSDYLVSPALQLEQGVLYRITMAPSPYSQSKTGKVSVGYGQGDNLESYTLLRTVTDIPYANSETAEVINVEFNVPSSGEYKIYFLGEGNALMLYNTTISTVGVSGTPGTVTGLTVLPADDGSASATVMFMLPTVTKSGAPLDGQLNYRIYRNGGDTHIKAGRGMPGETITWTDNNAPVGMVTYAVEVINGTDTGDRAEATSYIGAETPLPVTNLQVNASGNDYAISWTAPVEGIHGASLNPAMLTYEVVRVLDGETTVVAPNTASTTMTDHVSVSGSHQLQYKVTAILGTNRSEEATSSMLNIGSTGLPFADSFANATIGDMWSTEVLNGTINWTAVAQATTQQPLCQPQDNDGGMAFYNSWTAQRGHSARLATVPLSKASSTNPVVEFYICHHTNNNNDIVKLQVSVDGGDWQDVPDATVALKGDVAGQWEKYTFPIASMLPEGCTSYRVGFTAVSDYGHNTYLDNVRIFNVYGRDLSVDVKAPVTVTVGGTMTLNITVSNNGGTLATADDYQLVIDSDFPGAIPAIETVDIPSMSSHTYAVEIPVTAFEAIDMDSFAFSASVAYADDADTTNNTASTSVATMFSEHPAPATLTAEVQSDNSVLLSWDAVGESHVPVNFAESFEDFEPGTTGTFNGFVTLDLDEQDGGNYYNTSGSAFKVVTKPAVVSGQDGNKMIGLTLASSKQQDDWIITPELYCAADATMTLRFLLAAKKFSTYGYDYKYEVRYATGDYDESNPSEAFTNLLTTVTSGSYSSVFRADETFWEQNITDIPAEAKYVAIHFITKLSTVSAIWVDNVRITENASFGLLGYNVYDSALGRLNDTPIDGSMTQYLIAAQPTRSLSEYFVTAHYTDGESQPGPVASVQTSVSELSAATGYTVSKGCMTFEVAESHPVRIYDVQGLCVASIENAGRRTVTLPAGIYIVRIGSQSAKVVVR